MLSFSCFICRDNTHISGRTHNQYLQQPLPTPGPKITICPSAVIPSIFLYQQLPQPHVNRRISIKIGTATLPTKRAHLYGSKEKVKW